MALVIVLRYNEVLCYNENIYFLPRMLSINLGQDFTINTVEDGYKWMLFLKEEVFVDLNSKLWSRKR